MQNNKENHILIQVTNGCTCSYVKNNANTLVDLNLIALKLFGHALGQVKSPILI